MSAIVFNPSSPLPSLESQVENLQTTLASLNQQIIILQEALQDRDQQIAKLKQALEPRIDHTVSIAGILISLYKLLMSFPAREGKA